MPRILIATDATDWPGVLVPSLTNEGFEVELVTTGSQAMQKLLGGKFDLMVIEWELPHLPGVRICRGYRERNGSAHIIAISSRLGAGSRKDCLAAGANDVVSNPVNASELLIKIKETLKNSVHNKSEESLPCQDGNLIGKTLAGRYEIISQIGEGGMGIVYKARHLSLDRLVAIKVMLEDLTKDSAALQRFHREARVLSAVEHPNLILVHDFGETTSGQPFLVMELLEGKTLAEIIEKHGKVPLPIAIEVFVEICEGMQAAHDKGLIHRDLKPANVMLMKKHDKRMCKILDMGLAKFINHRGAKVTQTGQVFGSPLYMSPEQCLSSDNLDHRSDIYSLGCLMYESLTGEVPFRGDSFVSTSVKHMHEPPRRPSEICAEIPQWLEDLVLSCLNKQPGDRPASMADVKASIVQLRNVPKPKAVASDTLNAT